MSIIIGLIRVLIHLIFSSIKHKEKKYWKCPNCYEEYNSSKNGMNYCMKCGYQSDGKSTFYINSNEITTNQSIDNKIAKTYAIISYYFFLIPGIILTIIGVITFFSFQYHGINTFPICFFYNIYLIIGLLNILLSACIKIDVVNSITTGNTEKALKRGLVYIIISFIIFNIISAIFLIISRSKLEYSPEKYDYNHFNRYSINRPESNIKIIEKENGLYNQIKDITKLRDECLITEKEFVDIKQNILKVRVKGIEEVDKSIRHVTSIEDRKRESSDHNSLNNNYMRQTETPISTDMWAMEELQLQPNSFFHDNK